MAKYFGGRLTNFMGGGNIMTQTWGMVWQNNFGEWHGKIFFGAGVAKMFRGERLNVLQI